MTGFREEFRENFVLYYKEFTFPCIMTSIKEHIIESEFYEGA
jgi:hypothetical protein